MYFDGVLSNTGLNIFTPGSSFAFPMTSAWSRSSMVTMSPKSVIGENL